MSISPFTTSFAHGVYKSKYAHEGEEWPDTAARVAHHVITALYQAPRARRGQFGHAAIEDAERRLRKLIGERRFLPGGRYLYAAGRDLHQVQNCLLLRAEDTREGWGSLSQKAAMALMTGAGIGVHYGDIRPAGSTISRTGGEASGPVPLAGAINEWGRRVMQGGQRRSAIWAGLPWDHADIHTFIRAKDWPEEVRRLKGEAAQRGEDFPAELDMTNISVCLDDEFFRAYRDEQHPQHPQAREVYWRTISKMLTTAEPGFSIDCGHNRTENLRNACTEVTSRDDSDICNLGSLNIARFETKEQFASAVRDATLFLISGTLYSHLPYPEVDKVRTQNRRLGLGLMGIHEWLLARGRRYDLDTELACWLDEYKRSTEYAWDYADALGITRPVKTRAIAPTGTIGIVGETTTGIEPIFAAAYKRGVKTADHAGDKTNYTPVADPTAARLVAGGVNPDRIEDAYTLALDPERRVQFQAWVQQWVDHAISSTINLPAPVHDPAEQRSFGEMLIKYLPDLRGMTAYPDGARHGQPLTPCDLAWALEHEGVVYEETEERCVAGACGV